MCEYDWIPFYVVVCCCCCCCCSCSLCHRWKVDGRDISHTVWSLIIQNIHFRINHSYCIVFVCRWWWWWWWWWSTNVGEGSNEIYFHRHCFLYVHVYLLAHVHHTKSIIGFWKWRPPLDNDNFNHWLVEIAIIYGNRTIQNTYVRTQWNCK